MPGKISALFTTIVRVATLVGVGLAIYSVIREGPNELVGLLKPRSDPTPENVCGEIGPADMLAIVGSNAATWSGDGPYRIITMLGEPRLTVGRDEGGFYVDALVRSRDGRVISEIKRNAFVVNPNNYFTIEFSREDSELSVRDQFGKEAINVSMINWKTVRIHGYFYSADFLLLISDSEIKTFSIAGSRLIPRLNMSHTCESDVPSMVVVE